MTKRRNDNRSEPKFNSISIAQQNKNMDISMIDPDLMFVSASRGRDKNNITDINDSIGSLDYEVERSIGPFDEPPISNF